MCAFYDGGNNISLGKWIVRQLMIGSLFPAYVFIQPPGFGSYGYKAEHLISPVDVQDLCNGAQLMGRIVLAVAMHIISQPIMPVLSSVSYFLPKIMTVSALTMDNLTKKPF